MPILKQKLGQVLLGISGALILFILVLAFTLAYARGPCQISAVKIWVDNAPLELPVEDTIKILPEGSLIIAIEIEPKSVGCEIDWGLSFTSGPSEVEIISERPTRKVIKVTVGRSATEGLITLSMRDSAGNGRTTFIPLEVEEN